MKSLTDFSLWSSDEVNNWLNSINLRKYADNFSMNNLDGYDLCYLASDDLQLLGISNLHDKNTLLKEIRLKTLEEC